MKNLLKTALLITALSFALTTVNAQTEEEQKGKIQFESPTHNFGTNLLSGGNLTHRFEFTNTGDVPVTIQNVKASCGCTTPDWTKEPVAPGEKGFVDATYRVAVGNFSKTLTVTSNGDPQTIILTISGSVVKDPEPEVVPEPAAEQK
ncbi:MAG: DUF1573 domain-containing protein [Prevotellaceae bacterium]|nr:DUF1573 domain-containing protein [Prevotellaceae bacterium]